MRLFTIVSCTALYNGIRATPSAMPHDYEVFVIMGVGVLTKLALYIYSMARNKTDDGRFKSEMVCAMADDHLNDVGSNTAACIVLAVAMFVAGLVSTSTLRLML